MADTLTQAKQQQQVPVVVLQGYKGLSLKLDFANRDKNSWQQLDNFDLYVPGSLRKILPAVLYGGPYGANIYNCIEYLAQPNNPAGGIRRLIGVGADGKLYDLASATPATPYLDTSALLGVPPTIPYILQQSGFYVPFNVLSWQKSTAYALHDAVLEYSPVDGQLYVFAVTTAGTSSGTVEPIWPISGIIVDGTVTWTNEGVADSTRFLTNFLVIGVPGKRPVRVNEWQYDPTDSGETPSYTQAYMGRAAPTMPIQLTGTVITPNLNGYAPSAGRAYLWALYNPNTLQESAPSPFTSQVRITETDNSNLNVTINGSILLPLPPTAKATIYTSYQSYYVAIPASTAVASGYTCIRVYATKDGGTVFWLVPTLFDDQGNQISNGDGSIPISLLTSLQVANSWQDYFPVPEPQALQNSFRVYEGSGPVNLAPDPVNLGPDAWFQQPGFGSAIYVAPSAAPDGANALECDTSGAIQAWVSSTIAVKPSTAYYFQMFLDKTNATGGVMKVVIQNRVGTTFLTLTQTDGTASTLSGTFTTGSGVHNVRIRVSINAAVSITADSGVLWADPVFEEGSSLNPVPTNYPTDDNALVVPAPAFGTNYPPPVLNAIEVILDAMFVVDGSDQTKIWYSQQGQFEKFGQNAFVRTTITKNADQILEVINCFDRLLIGKGRSVEQISSYPPTTPQKVDPQHGMLARRSSVSWGTNLLALMTNGLGQLSLSAALIENIVSTGLQAELFGDDIKPLIDEIDQTTLHATNNGPVLPCPTIWNKLDLYLLAFRKQASLS